MRLKFRLTLQDSSAACSGVFPDMTPAAGSNARQRNTLPLAWGTESRICGGGGSGKEAESLNTSFGLHQGRRHCAGAPRGGGGDSAETYR